MDAEKWLEQQFEFEYCPECGGDADDHDVVLILGNPFAHCRKPLPEDMPGEEREKELDRRAELQEAGKSF